MMEGVNSTMIYCKNFCKCHMYSNNMKIKKCKKMQEAAKT
jgi:hypothetical protein